MFVWKKRTEVTDTARLEEIQKWNPTRKQIESENQREPHK